MFPNASAASPCANLSDSICAIAPFAVLVRVYPVRQAVTHVFAADFQRVSVERRSANQIAWLTRKRFSQVADWRRAHDLHLPTGSLYRTPEPYQAGYVPEDDFTFGLTPARYIAAFEGGNGR
ncbi:hypothetical protein GCM10027091_20660 [Streptomyces daliensis]